MSGAFSAKVDISTREAIAGLRAARDEAKLFGQGLNDLDKIIRANKDNLKLAVKEFTDLVVAQRAAASASKDLAAAQIAEARATGIMNVATSKAAANNADAAKKTAEKDRAVAQGGLATARTAAVVDQHTASMDRNSRANTRAARSQLELKDSLSNTRYLMYDVGATYGVISAGLLAIPAATAAVAMAYQKDFAQVERVSNDAASKAALPELRQSLKDIATDIPIAFGELSRITQLGAQMGVANTKLSEFTNTTAKFVAVTGISADTGATMFGRMESSFSKDVAKYPDFFERLGSSIAYVGAETVATDPEIAALLAQIGPLGAEAGFSAAEITGLSAALASVRVQPELARGTLTRIFGQLNRDVGTGSPRLAEFGKMLGVTADQAAKLWQSNPAQFFQGLIKGLNETHLNGGNLTMTLDKLGIKASRDVSAVTKLAVGYDTLDLSMKAANKGFAEGTALNEMSKPIFDTAVAKLQKMANAWQNLMDTLGSSSLGPMGALIDIAANLATGLDHLIKDVPQVGYLITALMGFAAVTAIFLGFKAAQAFVIAGFVGFQQASARGIGASMSMSGVLKQAAQTMLITKGATDAHSRALLGQAGAWKSLQIAATTSSARIAATATVSNAAATSTTAATSGVRSFGSSLLGLAGGPIGIAIIALSALAGGLISTKVEADSAGKAIAEAMGQGSAAGLRSAAEELTKVKVNPVDTVAFSLWGKNLRQLAEESDVSFQKLAIAATKGKDAVKNITPEFDRVARSKGFKDFQDFYDHGGTDVAGLSVLKKKLEEVAGASTSSAKDMKAIEDAAPKAGKGLKEMGDGADEASTPIEDMEKALKALNDEIFGTINAEAALQDSLTKIGAGLQKSQSYSPTSEGGRQNLQNLQDTLTKARTYYKQLMDEGSLSAQEAAQNYADFTTNLLSEIKNTYGGDTSYVEQLAEAARAKFATTIGGNPVTVPVQVDTAQVQTMAVKANATMQDFVLAQGIPTIPINATTDQAQSKTLDLAYWLAQITGMPYKVVLDALTDPANEKSKDLYSLITSITDGTYVAPIDADTTAAVANVKNFSDYARKELANIQYAMQGLGEGGVGLDTFGMAAAKKKYSGLMVPTTTAAPKQVKSTPTAAPSLKNVNTGLGGIADGYKKAGEEAEKAGKKGKKAGEDMADGISDAVRAAEDYANRLKTGLTSAFNQQYGLTKATDEYHSALNAINKKREDEIKQVSDLRDKIRDLNNERNKELITANKAKIEQGISVKYGETDRAADYGQQAKTALDNAAAKQKEIDVSQKQATEIQNGIGLLTGYSDAAIANREALRGLEAKTLDMIAAYAAQGHSIDEVRAYAQALTGQFQKDVGQMGLNAAAVQGLTGDLGRYIDVINSVPLVKPTKVEADTDQATREMADFGRAADEATRDRSTNVELTIGDEFQAFLDKKGKFATLNDIDGLTFRPGNSLRVPGLTAPSNYMGGQVQGFYSGGQVPGQSPSNPHADNMMAKVDGKGLIGIRSREWIIPEPAVDYYGPDFMKAVQTTKLPKYFMGGSPSGATGSGSMGGGAIELGASSLKALTEAMRTEVSVQLDSREIARASNKGNKQLVSEGHN